MTAAVDEDPTSIRADLSTIAFPAASLSGVTAFSAPSHVPREEHATLFARIRGWLRPAGLFLATLGARDSPEEPEGSVPFLWILARTTGRTRIAP